VTQYVLDASILVELILDSDRALIADRLLHAENTSACTLDCARLEVVSALRRLVLRGEVSEQLAARGLRDLSAGPVRRWPLDGLTERVWQLRDSASPYDAAYVALAEALGATLLTFDQRLASGMKNVAACKIIVPIPETDAAPDADAARESALDRGYAQLAGEFAVPEQAAEQRAARDRYARRSAR
jgi:predicted nucleic acid-binding protein